MGDLEFKTFYQVRIIRPKRPTASFSFINVEEALHCFSEYGRAKSSKKMDVELYSMCGVCSSGEPVTSDLKKEIYEKIVDADEGIHSDYKINVFSAINPDWETVYFSSPSCWEMLLLKKPFGKSIEENVSVMV